MNSILTENLSRLWSSIIIDELTKHQIYDFYCAPGMRNAPILASITKNKDAKAYSFFDERSLSYRALGNSKKNHSNWLLPSSILKRWTAKLWRILLKLELSSSESEKKE